MDNAPNVSAFEAGGFTMDFSAVNKNVWTPGWTPKAVPPPAFVATDVISLQLGTIAQTDNDVPPGAVQIEDRFNRTIRSVQTFTLNEQAWVSLPTYLTGAFTFAGSANAATSATLTGTIDILDNAAAVVGPSVVINKTRNASQGNLNINDEFHLSGALLPAGNYTVRATLQVTGTSGLGTPVGDNVQQDIITTARHGLVTSLAIYPLNLGDSRAAVTAPTARTAFGVDGTGVKVGILEPGEVYNTHTKLPMPNANYLGGAPAAGGSDFDEHALATAGIIAARTAGVPAGDQGIAPGATIISGGSVKGGGAHATAGALIAAGVDVINMSATSPTFSDAQANTLITANPLVTFVKSSGNSEPSGANSITTPGMAENIITVGGLNRDFTRRADYSSYSHTAAPIKPDLVAPSEYISAPNSRDLNFNTVNDDFNRAFSADDFNRTTGPTNGAVSGTSFSAPHVAGAAALMVEYGKKPVNAFDAEAVDHRVIKVNLLHGASTFVPGTTNKLRHQDNATLWNQQTDAGIPGGGVLASPGTPLKVQRSLDTELGAGILDTNGALSIYSKGEVRQPDNYVEDANNTGIGMTIDAESHLLQKGGFWDLEDVASNRRVDYLLGDITGAAFKVTLTWDRVGGSLAPLNLSLWHDGESDLDIPGFHADEFDHLFAETVSDVITSENVKMMSFTVPNLGFFENNGYFLSVVNTGAAAGLFAITISVPEPSSAMVLLAAVGLVWARRRR